MKKVTVTIYGQVTYAASRTFEMELPEDQNLELLSTETLNDLADEAQATWSFGDEGHIHPREHHIEAA